MPVETSILSEAALRARAHARHDGLLECIENDRSSSDLLGLLRGRVQEPRPAQQRGARAPVKFRLPAVRPGRPVANGVRTMHIRIMTSDTRTAADVDKYVALARESETEDRALERAGERVGAAGNDGYATRDRSAAGDRPEEQIVTNLPCTSRHRKPIWDACEAHEVALHAKGEGRINVRRDIQPVFWEQVLDHADCPGDLHKFLAEQHSDDARPPATRRANIGRPFISPQARQAERWLASEFDQFAPGHVGKPPFKFSSGRKVEGCRHGDFELPKELDNAARRRVAEEFARWLNSEATAKELAVELADGSMVAGQLPLVVALHAPEADNHKDNGHVHFQYGLRAIAFDNDGQIRFAALKPKAFTALGAYKTFREGVASIINVELEMARAAIRVSGASFAVLGIDSKPQRHLGPGLAQIEARGGVTEAGLSNRIESWRRPLRDNEQYVADRRREIARDDELLQHRVEVVLQQSPVDRRVLDEDRLEVRRLAGDALEARALAKYAEQVIDMAQSEAFARRRRAIQRLAHARPAERSARLQDVDDADTDLMAQIDDLEPEYATYNQASHQADAKDVEWKVRRTALDLRMIQVQDRGQILVRARRELEAAAHLASSTRIHRIVDLIERTPLVLTSDGEFWRVDSNDDPENLVASIDLASADIQRRLRGLAQKHERERASVVAWITKHGADSLNGVELEAATPHVEEQVMRWRNSRPIIEAAGFLRSRAANASQAQPRAMPPAATPIDVADRAPGQYAREGVAAINAMIAGIRQQAAAELGPIVRISEDPNTLVSNAAILKKSFDTAQVWMMRALGVTQATPTAEISRDLSTGSKVNILGLSGAASTQLIAGETLPLITIEPSSDKVTAMMARVFYGADWIAADYFPLAGNGIGKIARLPSVASHTEKARQSFSTVAAPIAKNEDFCLSSIIVACVGEDWSL